MDVVQSGNNREPIFFDDSDYQAYLIWLLEATKRYQSDIHAYVMMTNHAHILATPNELGSISRMMQYVGRRNLQLIAGPVFPVTPVAETTI